MNIQITIHPLSTDGAIVILAICPLPSKLFFDLVTLTFGLWPWSNLTYAKIQVYAERVRQYQNYYIKKRIRFENTPRRSPNIHIMVSIVSVFLAACVSLIEKLHKDQWFLHRHAASLIHQAKAPMKLFLTWWPWPLTYDLDLWTWPRYPSTWPTHQRSGLYVCPFSRESVHRQTDTHTQTMSKLLHPSLTRGVTTCHHIHGCLPLYLALSQLLSLAQRCLSIVKVQSHW